MKPTKQLRQMLVGGELIIAPGAYDCVTARLIQLAGFPTVYMTGAGTSASRLGAPDYGLLTMSEMALNAGAIARCVDVPVIADADTGYGNEFNVARTVREYELQGVAGLHIEDQVFPKRCGHLEGKAIIPREEFIAKIRVAAYARRDPDFVIIARTDAIAVAGFDEAIERANAALENGADVAFVEAPENSEQLRKIPQLVKGPCLINLVKGGKTPEITFAQAEAYGYRIAILPTLLLTTVMEACSRVLKETLQRRCLPTSGLNITLRELFETFGAKEWDRLREIAEGTESEQKEP